MYILQQFYHRAGLSCMAMSHPLLVSQQKHRQYGVHSPGISYPFKYLYKATIASPARAALKSVMFFPSKYPSVRPCSIVENGNKLQRQLAGSLFASSQSPYFFSLFYSYQCKFAIRKLPGII